MLTSNTVTLSYANTGNYGVVQADEITIHCDANGIISTVLSITESNGTLIVANTKVVTFSNTITFIGNDGVQVQITGNSKINQDVSNTGNPTFATMNVNGTISGNGILIGTNTNVPGGWLNTFKTASGVQLSVLAIQDGNPQSGDALIGFFDGNNVTRGSIAWNGTTAVQYNTTSDERLKEWIGINQNDYKSVIKSLWVGDFIWRSDNNPGFGIRAQQAYKLFPYAIKAPKNDELWEVDYGKLAPLALWGVKDLYNEIEKMKNEIETLKEKVNKLLH